MIRDQFATYQINIQEAGLSEPIPEKRLAQTPSYQCKSKKKCCKKFKRGKQCGSCPKMKMMIELMEKANFQC